jgi:two-component system, NtrC family, response regulator AtoC
VNSPLAPARILVVDDEAMARESLCALLAKENYQVWETGEGDKVESMVGEWRPEVVLLDLRLPGKDGLSILKSLHHVPVPPSVIVMTAYGTSETAIQAIKHGAFDYVTKPLNFDELHLAIQRALEYRRLSAQVQVLRENYAAAVGLRNMVGNSPAMQAIYKMIGRVAPTEATVLIRGESGTGKELVAEALHVHSQRDRGPLIKVNCAAIPDTLLEAELFGYEKGAFTGAHQQHLGRFEQASSGTIFLDEIGELSASTQAKLLRILQERTLERLGGRQTLSVDVRVITATGRNLEEAVRAGQFREDLYYRLNVVSLQLPPLREHKQDIPELVEHLLRKHEVRLGVSSPGLSRDALELLLDYDWPGNVRQLENVLQRALVLGRGRALTQELIHLESPQSGPAERQVSMDSVDPARGFKESIAELERTLIVKALAAAQGNRSRAAAILKIQRRLLYAKMQEYGLGSP